MKRTRYDLFQFDPATAERFPFYGRADGYTKAEADALIKQHRAVGCYLSKRIRKEIWDDNHVKNAL